MIWKKSPGGILLRAGEPNHDPRKKSFRPTFHGLPKYQKGVLHPVGFWAAGGTSDFSPTNNGQVHANGNLVYSYGYDYYSYLYTLYGYGTAGAWLYATASDCEVRVGADVGNSGYAGGTSRVWYNTSGTPTNITQGTAGTGHTIFTLNESVGTLIIDYTDTNNYTSGGSPVFAAIGTFTDNSEFTPTLSTKYGRKVTGYSQKPAGYYGAYISAGTVQFDLTFKKSGYNDYTISYHIYGYGYAEGV